MKTNLAICALRYNAEEASAMPNVASQSESVPLLGLTLCDLNNGPNGEATL